MARKSFLGIRIAPELKKGLEEAAEIEERSVSQICELLLRNGLDAYKKEGPRYLRQLSPRQKTEVSR